MKSSLIVHLIDYSHVYLRYCSQVEFRAIFTDLSKESGDFSSEYSVSSLWIWERSNIAQYSASLICKFKQCTSGYEWRNPCFRELDRFRSSLQAWFPRCRLTAGCVMKVLMCSHENAGKRFCRPKSRQAMILENESLLPRQPGNRHPTKRL
mgnify:FL=1